MKIRVHQNSIIPSMVGSDAITLYPFIFLRISLEEAKTNKLFNHEWIHILQIRKFGIIKFYTSYLFEYIKNIFKYWNKTKAYYAISFETEAYMGMYDEPLPQESEYLVK